MGQGDGIGLREIGFPGGAKLHYFKQVADIGPDYDDPTKYEFNYPVVTSAPGFLGPNPNPDADGMDITATDLNE